MVIRMFWSSSPLWTSRNWPLLFVSPYICPLTYTVACGIVTLSMLSSTVICRSVACTALQRRIRLRRSVRKQERYLYMIKYRFLLIYQQFGLYLAGWGYPVKEHPLDQYRHQAPAFFNRLLQPPVPFGIDSEQGFARLDEFA